MRERNENSCLADRHSDRYMNGPLTLELSYSRAKCQVECSVLHGLQSSHWSLLKFITLSRTVHPVTDWSTDLSNHSDLSILGFKWILCKAGLLIKQVNWQNDQTKREEANFNSSQFVALRIRRIKSEDRDQQDHDRYIWRKRLIV